MQPLGVRFGVPGIAQYPAQAQGHKANQVVLEAIGELLGRDTPEVVDVESIGGPGFEQGLGRVNRGDGGLLGGRDARRLSRTRCRVRSGRPCRKDRFRR